MWKIKEFVERFIYWLIRDAEKALCKKCCVTCEYYHICKRDTGIKTEQKQRKELNIVTLQAEQRVNIERLDEFSEEEKSYTSEINRSLAEQLSHEILRYAKMATVNRTYIGGPQETFVRATIQVVNSNQEGEGVDR